MAHFGCFRKDSGDSGTEKQHLRCSFACDSGYPHVGSASASHEPPQQGVIDKGTDARFGAFVARRVAIVALGDGVRCYARGMEIFIYATKLVCEMGVWVQSVHTP